MTIHVKVFLTPEELAALPDQVDRSAALPPLGPGYVYVVQEQYGRYIYATVVKA